jgi:hypothetical protein
MLYPVRIGPLASRADADKTLNELDGMGIHDARIMKE